VMGDASTPLRSPPATQGASEGAEDLFRYPWPGPGNSEGPVDPDGWLQVVTNDALSTGRAATHLVPPDPGQARAPEEGEAE
jgi:hypothetical protein